MRIVRNFGILLIAIGIALFTVDHVSAYVDSMTKEQMLILNIKDSISKEYNQFLEKINDYKTVLPEISNFFVQYYEEILENDEKYKQTMQLIDEKAREVEKSAKKIKDYCDGNYIDQELNKKCELFNKNYNIFTNSYSELSDKYNSVIQEYNEWAKDTGYKVIAVNN